MLIGVSNSCANALVPPNLSMMSDAVMGCSLALSASESQRRIAFLINAPASRLRHKGAVIGSQKILAELNARIECGDIEKVDIANVLGIHPSGVTRLFADGRQLKHDEAVKLVAAFQLEPNVPPLPPPVWRLVAHHIAAKLALPLKEDDPRLQELVKELAAFSRFARNRQVQGLLQAAEHFFEAMQSREDSEPADLLKTDPQPAD